MNARIKQYLPGEICCGGERIFGKVLFGGLSSLSAHVDVRLWGPVCDVVKPSRLLE